MKGQFSLARFINKIARLVEDSFFLRHCLFLSVALLSILTIGYYFGTNDQAGHIPFLKKFADPSLYPDDPFLKLRLAKVSFFWFIFLPFLKLGILEQALFAAHFFSVYLTFLAIYRLSKTIFKNATAAFLAVAAFIFPHVSFGGFPVVEFGIVNRTFVLPFLLFTIEAYLNGRYLLSFLALGILYNLHLLSVNFVLGMLLVDSLLRIQDIGFKKLIKGMMLFTLAALPVLIWKFQTSSFIITPRWEWFSIFTKTILYHLYYPIASYPHIIFITVSGLSLLILFFLIRHRVIGKANNLTVINHFVAALILTIIIGFSPSIYPITFIVQLQAVRANTFLLIIAYLFSSAYIASRLEKKNIAFMEIALLIGALVFSFSPLLLLLVIGCHLFIKKGSRRRALMTITLLFFVSGFTWLVTHQYDLWKPGIHIKTIHSDWIAVQTWAKLNTKKNALFLTPLDKWGLYETTWRVVSERSTVVLLADLLEIALQPDTIEYWKTRFNDVAPGALQKYQGDFFANYQITRNAYYSQSTEQINKLVKKYRVDYVVSEKPNRWDLMIAYENNSYYIYKTR